MTGVDGLMVPPVPAEGVTVQVWRLAEQLAVVPPFNPMQLHNQGPLPLTDVSAPELHRFTVGVVVKVPPFEVPQAPFTACGDWT